MARRAIRGVAMAALATFLVAASSGCSGGSSSERSESAPLRVAVALYPIEEVVRRVGGDQVEIVRLTSPGVNSHDAELSAKTLDELARADAVFFLGGGFQPTVEHAIDGLGNSVAVVDLLTVVDGVAGDDPHVWLDPANMARIATEVAATLSRLAPFATALIEGNAATYRDEMTVLGDEMDKALVDCATTTVVTSHDAFGYLFRRLGLVQMAITGLDPAEQPSAQALAEIARTARAANVTTIFVDVTVSARFGETIADEIGAEVATLDPVESLGDTDIDAKATYASVQRRNIDALVQGLGCRR